MKHLKQFDKFNKKNVDYSKIYTMVYNGEILLIGKISNNPGNGIRDRGCILIGYIPNGKESHCLIRPSFWECIRDATSEEIEMYEMFSSANKFNL